METGCGYPLPPMRQQAKTRELRTNGPRPGTADWVLLAALTLIPMREPFPTLQLYLPERVLAIIAKTQLIWNDRCQYLRLTWRRPGGQDEIELAHHAAEGNAFVLMVDGSSASRRYRESPRRKQPLSS